MMNKKMDVNLAFAILLLAAAIVGMYFWIDNGKVEVEEIYQDTNEVRVQRPNVNSEMMVEDEMENIDMEDGAMMEDEMLDNEMEDDEMMKDEMSEGMQKQMLDN